MHGRLFLDRGGSKWKQLPNSNPNGKRYQPLLSQVNNHNRSKNQPLSTRCPGNTVTLTTYNRKIGESKVEQRPRAVESELLQKTEAKQRGRGRSKQLSIFSDTGWIREMGFKGNFPQMVRETGFKLRQYRDGPLDWRLMGKESQYSMYYTI